MGRTLKLQRQQSGFTIVELLIVIVVIGVLAALLITTFTGIKQRERNTERQRDIKDLHTAVESYYAANNKYPTLANINDSNWVKANFKGFDKESLRDPKSASYSLAAKPAAKVYAYAVTASDGTDCDNVTKDCAQYTLTATYEGGNTFAKNNLN